MVKESLLRLQYKAIPFSGALTLISTIISIVISLSIFLNLDPIVPTKVIGMITFYVIIALLSEDLRDLEPLATKIYDVLNKPDSIIPPKEKQTLIKKFTEDTVNQWYKAWILYDTIVNNNKETLTSKLARLKELIKKIPDGHLNIYQIIVIFGYFCYNVLAIKEGWFVNWWIDALIIGGIATILIIMSSSMIGIYKFFEAVFKCLKVTNETEIKYQLELLANFIVEGVHVYYYIDLSKYQSNASGIKIAPAGTTFTPEQIQKNDLKDLSQTVQEQISMLQTEKVKINGEIASLQDVKDI